MLTIGALFTSCSDDDETTPITLGANVTVTNTLVTISNLMKLKTSAAVLQILVR